MAQLEILWATRLDKEGRLVIMMCPHGVSEGLKEDIVKPFENI